MKKILMTGFILSLFLIIIPTNIYANDPIAGDSARLKTDNKAEINPQLRTMKLRAYLKKQNSVLAESADDFILSADKNNLDWRLLPSIAGIESTFGKFIPTNSYNPFGWGIYKNRVIYFSSFEEAIETTAQSLAEKYPDRIEAIARVYCPPNYSQWLIGVSFFMKEIELCLETADCLEPTL